jgi:hypothetical protein
MSVQFFDHQPGHSVAQFVVESVRPILVPKPARTRVSRQSIKASATDRSARRLSDNMRVHLPCG